MPDEADMANDYAEQFINSAVQAARGDIPQGQPGECELCGEYFHRLVGGACVPCRDKYRLP